ncbi:MAG TPA: TldD/PmbA family protein [Kofleriaceae bacterium]|nr:TldD/PmbA family protein [Kofleriaceae bacterium]
MFNRRRFLHAAGAGTALLAMPQFLAGCSRNGASSTTLPATTPENPFLAWFGVDEAMLRRVMAELTSRGATHADMYFQHTRNNSIAMEDGIISQASSTIEQGVGLRVVVGDQVGYAFTEDLTEPAMLGAARTAAAIASGGGSVKPEHFAYRDAAKGYYQIQVPWTEVGVDKKLPRIQKAEALVRAREPAVKKVTVYWGDSDERVMIVTREGRIITDHRPMARMFVNLTAEKNGKQQSNGSNVAGRRGFEWFTDAQLEKVTREAVERTMVLFDAKRPPAGELPVILAAGASGILLHEAIGHGLEADFNRKGTSIYASKLGQKIAPEFVTIVDDATLDNERGALNVDDEGRETERTVLVENGVLRSYLHDQISADHYKIKSTGSGRRESYRFAPMPRMRCTYMTDGPHTREEVIAAVKGTGIIAETFTNGQVQIGAGDYTFYIKNGWLVEGGKITAPIKDVNIIGNGPESLSRITMAANDSKLDTGGWTCGKDGQGVPVSQGLPTVLVSKMTVGGENHA